MYLSALFRKIIHSHFETFGRVTKDFERSKVREGKKTTMINHLEPILRLLNLQLQRQSCGRLERFFQSGYKDFVFKTHWATLGVVPKILPRV
jgi:hypothetical protein